jgi:hypothetical protein
MLKRKAFKIQNKLFNISKKPMVLFAWVSLLFFFGGFHSDKRIWKLLEAEILQYVNED